MPTDRPSIPVLLAILLSLAGCVRVGNNFQEQVGPSALARLPVKASDLGISDDSILCLDESRSDGSYRLWVLRRPGGSWLNPTAWPDGADHHRMPPSALTALFRSHLPRLDLGDPVEPQSRFAHWRLPDGSEVQLREIVTDRGWFATLEQVAM